MKKCLLILYFFALRFFVFSQPASEEIAQRMLNQVLLYPQEKIHLQTDKPYYMTGETIFFRIFLLDAFSHRPATMSRYVYAELIDTFQQVIIRKMIRPEHDMFYGSIFVSDEIPEGNYRLRAYTRTMTGRGEEYFFNKPIYIISSVKEKEKKGKRTVKKQPGFEVTFYPEGGNMIKGEYNKIAFKALGVDGNLLDIHGEVYSRDGEKLTEFQSMHDGMGYFMIKPENACYSLCRYGEENIRFELPLVYGDRYSIKTKWIQNYLWIAVNKPPDFDSLPVYLLIHTGGMLLYVDLWDWDKEFILLDKKQFPSGISHLLLLTEEYEPVSERLVFNLNEEDFPEIKPELDKEAYHAREKVELKIRIPVAEGNYSIAVTEDKTVFADTTSHILSTMFLTSELKGYVHNPGYYLIHDDPRATEAADLLMLTHGWRRYNIPSVLKEEYEYLPVAAEESQAIQGIVKGGIFSKPYEGSKVSILALESNFGDIVETDANGRFRFDNFEFPDSTRYMVQAMNKKGKDVVELYIDEIDYPEAKRYLSSRAGEKAITGTPEFKDYYVRSEWNYRYENGLRIIDLDEVSVKKKITKDSSDKRKYTSSYGAIPDWSFSEEEIERSAATNPAILISRLPGVTFSEGINGVISIARNVSIRGDGGLLAPLVIIDGMRMNSGSDDMEGAMEALTGLSITDIAQIDVIKSIGKLNMYGSKAYGGVIEIHTKKGDGIPDKLKFNTQRITPLGYHTPVEFYSPRYDRENPEKNALSDMRTTIYWKPNVMIDASGESSVSFYTADTPSTYSVMIEGVSTGGRLFRKYLKAIIDVKE